MQSTTVTLVLYFSEKPGIPQQPFIISSTKDSCVVCWKPPSSDGGAKITNYYLEKREKKQNKWMSASSKKIVETNYEVTGLIEGFEYEFRVKCENMGGESDWSEISAPIIPKSDQSPRAPTFREEIRDMTVKYHANATFVTKVLDLTKLHLLSRIHMVYLYSFRSKCDKTTSNCSVNVEGTSV